MGLDPLNLSAQLFTAWLLIAARLFGLLVTMPLFGERSVPWQSKAGLTLFTAFLLLPSAQGHLPLPADSLLVLGLGAARELLIGIALGYLARLLFGAFQFAVNVLDIQSGLAYAQVVNPAHDSFSVLGQFLNTLLLLLFLELDGHHLLLRALAASVQTVPLGSGGLPVGASAVIAELLGRCISFSMELALPAVLVLLLIDVAFGIIGRVVPQLNVFLMALPVKICVCLTTLSLTLPVLSSLMGRLLLELSQGLGTLLRMVR